MIDGSIDSRLFDSIDDSNGISHEDWVNTRSLLDGSMMGVETDGPG